MKNTDWSKEIPQGAFVSKNPTYKVGEYFNFLQKMIIKKALAVRIF